MNVLLWLRRDLRITDHPALAVASGLGRVMPVFIADPQEWQRGDLSARHWGFVADCLRDLREEYASLGLPLVVRRGPAADVFASLLRAYDITHVVTHTAHDPFASERDAALRDLAVARDVVWIEVDPDDDHPMPESITAPAEVAEGLIPDARALGLTGEGCGPAQAGGRRRGMALARNFVRKELRGLHDAMRCGDPSAAVRLQPHFAWGTLTARDLRALMADPELSPRDIESLLSLLRLQGMEKDEASLSGACASSPHFISWATGNTGWPFHDAAMRALRGTGSLPDSVINHVAQVAVGYMGISRGPVVKHLARNTVHYHPGRMAFWLKGCTTVEAAREHLPDPLRWGERADPEGRFIRQWIPELADVPDGFLHRPWDWMQDSAARRYPLPVCDPPNGRQNIRRKSVRPLIRQADLRQTTFDFAFPAFSVIAQGGGTA